MESTKVKFYPDELDRINRVKNVINTVEIGRITPLKDEDETPCFMVELFYEDVAELVRWMLDVEQEDKHTQKPNLN